MFNINRKLMAVMLSTTILVSVGCAPSEEEGGVNGITPSSWPVVKTHSLDSGVEAKVDSILGKMTLEQKVGQVIQADSNAVTPEEVKQYRLGSVLSGGNSAPGDLPYAGAKAWLDAADAYFEASIDPEGVEIAIPMVWGIDAVHGHTNLIGGTIFPHNIGLGAANDPVLVEKIAEITAAELSVSGHDWTFAPTLAVPQDDRWGRAYEGFSEDPEVVKSYGGAIVNGLQGEMGSEQFMASGRVISSAKHYLGDGGTDKGVDQGDARISEAELRDIHLPGYITAIEAGAQSVMASFSSWQGQPMHGQKELLTDVLKGRMNFKGFVVGDWNGHALIPGCTITDCPEALNAGLDMYMAPDSWKGLYESTLIHVKSGRIPMERLDDAVRRILRAKVQSGIFEKPKPSARALSGKIDLLGSDRHRSVAREAVRKSLVLLKNNNQTLPLSTASNVLVVGRGADSISKLAGGWTLSWQGGGHSNDVFPNGQTLLSAIKTEVEAGGGRVTYDADGNQTATEFDAVIAVYGEDPYAEFRGDRENVDFTPNDLNPEALKKFKDADVPVVSVFVSGRPLWTNPELNVSDAFVAAWLPGGEAAGISDLLFQTNPEHDFTGRLSFSWPKTAMQFKLNPHHEDFNPLFKLGYGLTYEDKVTVPFLSEDSGLGDDASSQKGVFFEKGASPQPWRAALDGANVDLPYNGQKLSASSYDHNAQEDALFLDYKSSAVFSFSSRYAHDFQRESNGAMELAFDSMWIAGPSTAEVGSACSDEQACNAFYKIELKPEWTENRIALKCFERAGGDIAVVKDAFLLRGQEGLNVAISNVRLKEESANSLDCSSD